MSDLDIFPADGFGDALPQLMVAAVPLAIVMLACAVWYARTRSRVALAVLLLGTLPMLAGAACWTVLGLRHLLDKR